LPTSPTAEMTAETIACLLSEAEVTAGEIRRAVVHLPKPLRKCLYDPESPEHKTAEGTFFESLVYEMLLQEGEQNPEIVSIVAKFGDAEYVPYDKYSHDGLWYSKDGGIRFKVRGNVAAEMDFLVKTADGMRIFGEVIVNPLHATGIEKEVKMKTELLKRLYGDEVGFVLVTASPLQNQFSGASCVIPEGNTAYLKVHSGEVLAKKLSPAPSTKRIDGTKW